DFDQGHIIEQNQQEIASSHREEIVDKEDAGETAEGKAVKREESDRTEKKKVEKAVSEKIDIDKVWTEMLKIIKKDRMGIYTLLRDAKLHWDAKNKNVVALVFPDKQGCFVAAIEKEEHSKYLEELLAEATGN